MKEIIAYLLGARSSNISWNSIAKNTSVNSPNTVHSYIEHLRQMYVVNIFYAISHDHKILYRKNKKVHFIDPFLIRTLAELTHTEILTENIVESIIAAHFARLFPCYYYFDKTEVDVVADISNKIIGFEVKWGPKSWKRPMKLKYVYLLDKKTIPLFLFQFRWNP